MAVTKFISIAALLVCFNSLQAAETLELNAETSKIEFVGKKSDGKHTGGFKKFTTKAIADFEKPENGKLDIEIEADSLWSDDEKLTNHLKNPDFFDVRKHEKITFKTTGLSIGEDDTDGKGNAKIKGDLTLLGKTAEIEVPCKVAINEKTIEVAATFVIDRTRWGMTYGEGKISNDVDVTALLIFNR